MQAPARTSSRDPLTPEQRRRAMRAVRSRDTGPERRMGALLASAGLGARVQARGLPGTPDFLLPVSGVAVMVHGCFWHGHACCRVPDAPYWREKVRRNRARDRRDARRLRALGWRVLVVRECSFARDAARVLRSAL